MKNIDFKKLSKNKIDYYIFENDEDLSLEQLFELNNELLNRGYDDFCLRYINDIINDRLDKIEDKNELIKFKDLMNKYNIDNSYINRLLRRIDSISDDDIKNLDKDDLEYYAYDGSVKLSFKQLFMIRQLLIDNNFDNFDIETIEAEIEDRMDENDYSIDELEVIKRDLKNNKVNTWPIDKILNNYYKDIKNNKKSSKKGLFWLLIGSLFSNNSNKSDRDNTLSDLEQEEIDKGNYEKYNFEEEELEDDDYYNDDLD